MYVDTLCASSGKVPYTEDTVDTQEQQSQATEPIMAPKRFSLATLRAYIAIIAISGLSLWGSIFLYQATPRFLDALGGVLLYWLALFYAIFISLVVCIAALAFVCLVLIFLIFAFESLYDHHHRLTVRRRYREFNYQRFKQRTQQQCLRYTRQQKLMRAYLHIIRYSPFYRPPRDQDDVS